MWLCSNVRLVSNMQCNRRTSKHTERKQRTGLVCSKAKVFNEIVLQAVKWICFSDAIKHVKFSSHAKRLAMLMTPQHSSCFNEVNEGFTAINYMHLHRRLCTFIPVIHS